MGTVGILLIVVAAFVAGFYLGYKNGSKIVNEVEADVNKVKADASTIKTAVNTVKVDASKVATEVSKVANEIKSDTKKA